MHLLSLRTVLVATDLHAGSAPALETGSRLASAAGASLHVGHVVNEAANDVDESRIMSASDLGSAVNVLLARGGHGTLDAQFHVLSRATAATAILSLANRIAADVVVLGPHRERQARAGNRVLGSTALELVIESGVPCLVTKKLLRIPVGQIVVLTDLSQTARGALLVALSWASALRSRGDEVDNGAETLLTLLHVRTSAARTAVTSTAALLESELERIRESAGRWAAVAIDSELVQAENVARAIAQFAEERRADLVVAGTRGLASDSVERLGSVSSELLRVLTVPLLFVPPAVWAAHAPAAQMSGESA